jgi:DNA-binding NarL/FixJ family response regulator
VPVVALSSADDKPTVLQALEAGAMGFVPKTSSAGVMLGALQLILARGIYLPPSVFLSAEPTGPVTAAAGPRQPQQLGLTPRQADVLYLILQGKPAKVISRELGLSPSTVKAHTSAVLRALNVTTRTQAVVAAGRLQMRFDPPMHMVSTPS